MGGGDPSTRGREPGMCPRAWAFGPRTSPRKRSSAPSSASSQATSTMDGNSDTLQEFAQKLVELGGPLDVREMTGAAQLHDIEAAELACGDERIELADHETHGPPKGPCHLGRVFAITDRLDSADEAVGISISERFVRRPPAVVEIWAHHP